MSQWTERVTGHAVWQVLPTLGATIDRAAQREEIEPSILDGIERVRAVLAIVGKRLAGTDPALSLLPPLDEIAAALDGADKDLQAFVADGNPGNVSNANAKADSALASLARVIVAVTPDETGALRDAALAYRQGVESQLKVVHAALSQTRTEAEGLRAKLAELATDVGTERQRVTTTISEFQSQFSAAQEARNKEHTEGQGKRQEAFATLLSEAQAQFATAQDSRNKDHAESQAKRQEVFAALEGDYQKRLAEQNAAFEANRVSTSQAYQSHIDGLKAEYAASAKGILDAMEKQKADVEKLVGVIGNLGVTSGYLKTANAARTQTWIWQGATVASLLSMIGFAYKAFLPVLDHATSSVLGNGQALQSASPGMSWLGFATRVLLTITVGVLAAYARSQADKNQEIERRNRKMALELEAMGPYLAPLPLEKQHEFRLSMGDRSFGKDDTVPSGATPSPATLLDVGSTYIDKVTELLKAAKK